MTSIRGRLAGRLLLALSGIVVFVVVLSRVLLGGWLEEEFDRALIAKAQALVTLTSQDAGEIDLDFADEYMPEFERATDPEYFQLWSSAGAVVERSHSLVTGDLARLPGLRFEPRIRNVDLADGRPGRSVQIDFVPQVEDDHLEEDVDVPLDPEQVVRNGSYLAATIVVAISRVELNSRAVRLDPAVGGLGLLVLLGTIVSVSGTVTSGLRPLTELAREVRKLGAESLDQTVELSEEPSELRDIVDQLNALLARLDAAFRRERHLSSALAHELRTPLSELQNLAEVVLEWPDDREAVKRYFSDVHSIGEQMQRVVSQLLQLARAEEGLETCAEAPVDLEEAVKSSWSRCRRRTGQLDACLDYVQAGGQPAVVTTDPDKLLLVLGNLFSNALAYRTAGTNLACVVDRGPDGTTLLIRNETDQLEEDDLDVMFDRFWRKDPARTGSLNVGLGLTLVRSLAERLGLGLRTSLRKDSVFEVELVFGTGVSAKGPARGSPGR